MRNDKLTDELLSLMSNNNELQHLMRLSYNEWVRSITNWYIMMFTMAKKYVNQNVVPS